MLSSTAVAPSVTTPSTGIFSPGRTRTRSPTTTCSTGTSTSAPSRSTRAVFGASPTRAVIAAAVRFLALRLHPPAGQDQGEDHQRGLEVHVQRQAPPLGGGRPQGDEGAVAVGDAGAQRDQGVHVGRAVPGGGPGGAVDVRGRPRTARRWRRRGWPASASPSCRGTAARTSAPSGPRPVARVICHLRFSAVRCVLAVAGRRSPASASVPAAGGGLASRRGVAV